MSSNKTLSSLERRMVRLAFSSQNPAIRRKILERLVNAGISRVALYNKEFLQAIENERYHNPSTGRKVKFVSLPKEVQKQVYQQWLSTHTHPTKTEKPEKEKEPQEEKDSKPSGSGKHKDRKELRGRPSKKLTDKVEVSEEVLQQLLPEGLAEEAQARAKEKLQNSTYKLLQALRNNLTAALSDPEGDYMKVMNDNGYSPQSMKKLQGLLNVQLRPVEGRKYAKPVLEIANKYDLESEDADELYDFRVDRPGKGQRLSWQSLMQKFLAHAKPETRERMQGMSLQDFMVMYKSILSEDEEETVEIEEGVSKKATRLPQQPHSEVSRAIEEGRLADEHENEKGFSIFDSPDEVFKKAALSDEDREIIRIARASNDPRVRRRLLSLIVPNKLS